MSEDEVFHAAKDLTQSKLGYDVSHSMRLKNAISELEETIIDLVITGAKKEYEESNSKGYNPSMIPLNINSITLGVIRHLSDSMYKRSILGFQHAMENHKRRHP